MDWFTTNYTMIVVIMGTVLLGIAGGAVGTMMMLKKQALVGDALSHATLPGVVLAFMLTGNKEMTHLLMGATIAAFIAMAMMHVIKKYTKIKDDAALALILSSFFGFGQLLLVEVQATGKASQAGLNRFIFGQAATMLRRDVYLIGAIAIIILVLVTIFWKEIKHFIFNQEHFETLGFHPGIVNGLLTVMSVIVVVIGIRTIGVILMSALLVAPSVASRQWSHKLTTNVLLASIFGAISGCLGTIISANQSNLPTGPVIVIFLSVFVIVSLLFSPKRGLIKEGIKTIVFKKRFNDHKALIDIYFGKALNASEIDQLVMQGYILKENQRMILTQKGKNLLDDLMGGDPV